MKQDKLNKHTKMSKKVEVAKPEPREKTATRMMDIDLSDFKSHPLWKILVETTMRSPLYPNLAGYYRDKILPQNPDISPKELAGKLSITIGEALVILDANGAY
ncbi:MAG: hypothetical protein P1Q69_04280 [Candidatus Thorarchaeota archaeon]|nr:hypothetical protein [Candidatus Thorarchaeota archaeon]